MMLGVVARLLLVNASDFSRTTPATLVRLPRPQLLHQPCNGALDGVGVPLDRADRVAFPGELQGDHLRSVGLVTAHVLQCGDPRPPLRVWDALVGGAEEHESGGVNSIDHTERRAAVELQKIVCSEWPHHLTGMVSGEGLRHDPLRNVGRADHCDTPRQHRQAT